MNTKTKVAFYKLVFLFLIIACVPPISAQDRVPPVDFVVDGRNIADFQWLADSTGLILTDWLSSVNRWRESEYLLEVQQRRPSHDFPLIQRLGLREMPLTKALFTHTGSSVFWPSQDTQWAVYPVIEEEQEYLVLHKIQTDEVRILYDAPLLSVFSGNLEVHWSENSSAFYVYNTDGPVTYWYYVSNFTESLDDAHVLGLHQENTPFRTAVRGFHEVLDIDATGDFLLIERVIRVDDKLQSNLIIVNMNDYSFTSLVFVVTRGVIAASFGTSGEIFYISHEGLFVYDLENNLARLLRSDINSSWTYDAEISPDGRYVAAIKAENRIGLYIIPVIPD